MFDKKDLVHVKNLQRLLSKAKMELEGQEILAAADVLQWVGRLGQKIDADVQTQEAQAKLAQGIEKQPQIVVATAPSKPESLPNKRKSSRQDRKANGEGS